MEVLQKQIGSHVVMIGEYVWPWKNLCPAEVNSIGIHLPEAGKQLQQLSCYHQILKITEESKKN